MSKGTNTTPVFSSDPGCRERHFQRKFNNPLFPEPERQVTQEKVDEARAQDEREAHEFLLELQSLLQEVGTLQSNIETQAILDMKVKLDQLYEKCAGLGGNHSREKGGMVQLNETIMRSIRAAAGNDPQAIDELDKEQAAREIHQNLLEYKLVPHLLREDSPVGEEELVPTLLSEDTETLRIIMSLFEPEQQQQLIETAQQLIESLEEVGEDIADARDKLKAMKAHLQ